MKLTPNLEDFSSKIFKEKPTTSKSKDDINNRIVYLPYTKEDLKNDIDLLSSPHLINLKDLIEAIEKKQVIQKKKLMKLKT